MSEVVPILAGIVLALRLGWRWLQLRNAIIVPGKIVDVEIKAADRVVGDLPPGAFPPEPWYQLLTIRFRDPSGSYRSVALQSDGIYRVGQSVFVVINKNNSDSVDYHDPRIERNTTAILIALFAIILLVYGAAKLRAVFGI
jgi:hypothetical protein